MISMLGWYFYVGKDKFTQAVYPRHQCRRVTVVGGIKMKDIPAGHCHFLANFRCSQTMGCCQKDDKFTPQITNFRRRQTDVTRYQLSPYFLNGTIPPEQGLTNKNEQVIGDIASFWNNTLQRFRGKDTVTVVTHQNGLSGDKWSRQTEDCFPSGLLHCELSPTERTTLGLWTKMDNRWSRE